MANDWTDYLVGYPGNNSLTGGGGSSSGGFNPMNPIDPFGFLGGLFGSDSPGPPYTVDPKTGMGSYPYSVPAPPRTVPNARLYPSETELNAADTVQSFVNLFPSVSKAMAGQIIPQEQAKLAAAQVTSDPYAQLMLDLYKKFGPQLNDLGNQIAQQNAMAQAGRDTAVIAGPGQELIKQALAIAKQYDPEFFATRATTSDRLDELMKSIQLGAGLTGSERSEIERSLAQNATRTGTTAPSNIETVGNAMQYGEAGRNREMQQQNQLSKAIAASTAFLPASRSGVDTFQIATGRSSVPNSGESKFTGVAPVGNDAQSLAQNAFGNLTNFASNDMNRITNQQLQTKDWLDKFTQFTSGLKDVVGIAGMAAGMCWVAREVYGVNDGRWLQFREWLLTRAPSWFRDLYRTHGEQFAKFISNKPRLKLIIRNWMNRRIQYVK